MNHCGSFWWTCWTRVWVTHTLAHIFCSLPGGWNTTSASVWVNPYVCEGVRTVRYQSEGESVNREQAVKQAVLLHNGRHKKSRPWLSSSASSPGQRTDGGRRKRASGGSLPCHSSTDAPFIYWKINQTRGQACPGRPFDLLQPYWALFSIPPTGPQLMATLCNV